MDDRPVYSVAEHDVYGFLDSSPEGLTAAEAARRLEQLGPNVLEEKRAVPLWRKILSQFTHLLAILLWAAGDMASLSNSVPLGIACFLVIFINAAFSFWQEYKAEKAIESLKPVSYTHLRAHETRHDLVCRLLL